MADFESDSDEDADDGLINRGDLTLAQRCDVLESYMHDVSVEHEWAAIRKIADQMFPKNSAAATD